MCQVTSSFNIFSILCSAAEFSDRYFHDIFELFGFVSSSGKKSTNTWSWLLSDCFDSLWPELLEILYSERVGWVDLLQQTVSKGYYFSLIRGGSVKLLSHQSGINTSILLSHADSDTDTYVRLGIWLYSKWCIDVRTYYHGWCHSHLDLRGLNILQVIQSSSLLIQIL